jgi:hypothetical protein
MRIRIIAASFMALLVGVVAQTASAQADDCHCDCYFSADCESGDFCWWGTLSDEDSCWWRQPKPQGTIGAGCDADFDDWGRCDGICTPTALGAQLVGAEVRADLSRGVGLWMQTFTETSLAGGGAPAMETLHRIETIGFENPTMSYGLWRMAIEVMTLSRGEAYVIYPKAETYPLTDVGVADLRGATTLLRNGELAARALLAEIEQAGSGRDLVGLIDPSTLDADLYGRICPSGDRLACLYERIADIGEVLGRGSNRGGTLEGGAMCAACAGDCVPSDAIDTEDLLSLLSMWGRSDFPCEDLNGDGRVDTADLLNLLSRWGVCAEFP